MFIGEIMKSFIKNVKIFCILSIIISSFFLMGCARVEPCTMEELIGTYKLINYKRAYYTKNENDESVLDREEDLLKSNKIEMFLIITGEEFGYVVYKDKDTNLLIRQVKLKYNYEFEAVNGETVYTDKISTVEYKTLVGKDYEKIQDAWANLGTTKNGKKLNNTHHEYKGFYKTHLYTDYVDYEKVSKEKDLSYIKEKYTVLPQTEEYQII